MNDLDWIENVSPDIACVYVGMKFMVPINDSFKGSVFTITKLGTDRWGEYCEFEWKDYNNDTIDSFMSTRQAKKHIEKGEWIVIQ